jgi:prevent-host-death family protein
MKTMAVGEFKARFSEAVEAVKHGEEIVISYGKKRQNIAVLVPYASFKHKNAITLGSLAGKASVQFADDFEMSADELVGE